MKNVLLAALLAALASPASAAVARLTVSPVAHRFAAVAAFSPLNGAGSALRLTGSASRFVPRLSVDAPALKSAPKLFVSPVKSPASSALFGLKTPAEGKVKALFDGSRGLQDWEEEGPVPVPNSGKNVRSTELYWPTREEVMKLRKAYEEGTQRSKLAWDLERDARDKGVRFVTDRAPKPYHGEAFRDQNGSPFIALTVDTLAGSWAFVAAIKAREQTYLNGFYGDIPNSAEKLAVAYAHMAMVFAQVTGGSAKSWRTDLDHDHMGRGTYFVWSWYQGLLEAVKARSFIDSRFYTGLRDGTSKHVSDDVSYQYSLYERYTGAYWRPGRPEHQQPIPADVPRLGQAEYDAATAKVYGRDGNGDAGTIHDTENFLGIIRDFFRRRGNI